MADNVNVTPSGSTPIAADDIAGILHQRVKVQFGADGSATDVSSTAPLPTTIAVAASAVLANVNDTASSATLAASNASRRGLIVYNDSTAILYLKYGATASATSFTDRIEPQERWVMPFPIYTGVVDGIWASDASGAARVTELT